MGVRVRAMETQKWLQRLHLVREHDLEATSMSSEASPILNATALLAAYLEIPRRRHNRVGFGAARCSLNSRRKFDIET